jgi:NAD(P)-dependent dehydrogenase (short-subunit alcohol dehydrogenase family)
LDVSDFSQAQQVMSEFRNGNDNSLSVLSNNAGILEVGAFEDINNNQHQRVISVNVMGLSIYAKQHGRT